MSTPGARSPPSMEVIPVRPRFARQLQHGPRRMLITPWRRVCRCGYGAWPCYPLALMTAQALWAQVESGKHPGWDAATSRLPVAPLRTRGQAARSQSRGHW